MLRASHADSHKYPSVSIDLATEALKKALVVIRDQFPGSECRGVLTSPQPGSGFNVMEMLLEPSRVQMNGRWKRHSRRERRGEGIDLRLTKDKDTCARKKGWSDCSHQPWLLNQTLRSGLHAHSTQGY